MRNYLGVQARTRGGVFGPGGYGGGIFDGSGMGFGGLGSDQAPAAIKGFGASGLGQACSIPSTCTYVRNVYAADVSASLRADIADYCDQGWFEDTAEWQARQAATSAACQNVYNLNQAAAPTEQEYTTVLPEEYMEFSEEVSPSTGPAYTAPTTTTPSAPYPWNTYSSATRTLQLAANVALRDMNQPTIGEDGKLGPETCGAIRYLSDRDVPIDVPGTCQSFSYSPRSAAVPGPIVSAAPPTAAAPPMETAPGVARAGMSGATMAIAGIAVLGIGAGIIAATRKKK